MRDGDPVKVTKRQGNRMRKERMGDGKNENVKKTGEVDEEREDGSAKNDR